MPRKALSAEAMRAKSDKAEAEAMVLRINAEKKEVTQLMDTSPDIVGPLLQHAKKLANKENTFMQAGLGKQPAQPQPLKLKVPLHGPSPEERASLLAFPLDRHAHKIARLGIQELYLILFELNPLRFTPYALQSMRCKGQSHPSKEQLQQLLEYVTQLDADTELPKTAFTTLQDVVDLALKSLESMPYDRSEQVRLPPSWPLDGIYGIVSRSPEMIVVQHKFSQQEASVKPSMSFSWDRSPDSGLCEEPL